MMEFVPVAQASVKKLKGRIPINTKSQKWGLVLGIMPVNTKVRTPIMMMGFTSDQKMPSDIFR
jgi:hypothetical protein